MSATHVGQKAAPLVVEELVELVLVGLADRRKLDRVQAELFQVLQTEVPRAESNHPVKRAARRTEKAVIIWAQRHFDTRREQCS